MRLRHLSLFLSGLILIAVFCKIAFSGDISSRVRSNVKDAVTIRQRTQKEEDRWFEERNRLLERYKELKQENKVLSDEVKNLTNRISSNQKSIERLKRDISNIDEIKSEIEPFIISTYKRLCEFVEQGIPFLPDERKNRLRRLKKLIHDPTVRVSEKFRRLMEGIFIEAEYGNTIEVYQRKINVGKKSMFVNILRLGRVSLLFQSLDKSKCGYFDPLSGWKYLPNRYNECILHAIQIAQKRRPAEIIDLPIGRIKTK